MAEDNVEALFAEVEEAFREHYSALPVAYEVFGVKMIFQAKDTDVLACALVPWLFPNKEAACSYRDLLVDDLEMASAMIGHWLSVGAIELPQVCHTHWWSGVTACVVPLHVGEILTASDM